MKCGKRLVLFILFILLVSTIDCLSNDVENSAFSNKAISRNAAAPMHTISKRSSEDYIQYYAIQPRGGKQYPPYYTTVRCNQYYRKPGKRPQCVEELPVKSQTTNGNNFQLSRIDTDVSNKLDETQYQQRPSTALPDIIRMPIQTLPSQKPSQQFAITTLTEYNTKPFLRNSVDLDAQVAELTDLIERAPSREPTSLLDFIFSRFKQRRRIQEQIAATYLKHYGESR